MELKFYNSRRTLVGYLVLSLLLSAGGVLFLYKLHGSTWDISFGIFSVAFFFLGAAVFLYQIFNRKPQLILNEYGVWAVGLEDGKLVRWDKVEYCSLLKVFSQKFICLKTDEVPPFKSKKYYKLKKLDKKLGAADFNIAISQLRVNSEKLFTFFQILSSAGFTERKALLNEFAAKNF